MLTERGKRSTEEEDRLLLVSHKFDHFTYWNLDKEPSSDDLTQRAMQWIDLSSVVCINCYCLRQYKLLVIL